MASRDNKDVCIAGSNIEGEVKVKLAAKLLINILSLAIQNINTATKP